MVSKPKPDKAPYSPSFYLSFESLASPIPSWQAQKSARANANANPIRLMLGLLQTRPGLFWPYAEDQQPGGREGGLTVIKARAAAHAHPMALMRNEEWTARRTDGRTRT